MRRLSWMIVVLLSLCLPMVGEGQSIRYYPADADRRTLYVTTTPVGNVGVGEDTLASFVVPGNTLGADGATLKVETFGTLAGNANSKRIKLLYGGQTLQNSVNTTASYVRFQLINTVVRTGASAQAVQGESFRGAYNASYAFGGGEAASTFAIDNSAANTLSLTCEAVDNNDCVMLYFRVTLIR